MTQFLYLLRHGATDRDPGAPDRKRYLTQAGVDQCHRVADFLTTGNVKDGQIGLPDLIVPSGVRRTNETAKALVNQADQLSDDQITPDERLYGAGVETYLNVIREYGQMTDRLMIIGHNPTIYQLAMYLASDCRNVQLNRGYPPATLTVFELKDLTHLTVVSAMTQFAP